MPSSPCRRASSSRRRPSIVAKYAHFPGGGPAGAICRNCGHLGTYQAAVKDGRGNQVPTGTPVHWCQKAADFIQARPDPKGKKPKGVGALPTATDACKYYQGETHG